MSDLKKKTTDVSARVLIKKKYQDAENSHAFVKIWLKSLSYNFELTIMSQ